mgnify:FL=1
MSEPQDKAAPDWERIESDYRAGVLSLREIAAPFKVTEGAIRKRAKRDGWERDLNAKIHARAEALVRKAEVRSAVRNSPESVLSDRVIIEANAERIAQVKGEHRANAGRTRDLALSMLTELEAMTAEPGTFERLREILAGDPESEGMVKAMEDAFRRATGLPGRINSLKTLAEALRIAVALERESYGMDAAIEPGKTGVVQGAVVYRANMPFRGTPDD